MLLTKWLKLQKWFETSGILRTLTEFISCCVRATMCSQNANVLDQFLSIFWYRWCLISSLKILKSAFDFWWFFNLDCSLKVIYKDDEWRLCLRFNFNLENLTCANSLKSANSSNSFNFCNINSILNFRFYRSEMLSFI